MCLFVCLHTTQIGIAVLAFLMAHASMRASNDNEVAADTAPVVQHADASGEGSAMSSDNDVVRISAIDDVGAALILATRQAN